MGCAGCKVLVGIPSTTVELDDYVFNPRGRDFLRSQGLSIQKYRQQILEPFAELAQIWQKMGVKIYPGATLDTFATALDDGPTEALILISHWLDEPEPAIELFTGMEPIAAVVATFPPDLKAVIDLCICTSIGLAKLLSSRCQGVLIKWINVPATPVIWFYIYTATFRLMHDRGFDYLSALEQTIKEAANVSQSQA